MSAIESIHAAGRSLRMAGCAFFILLLSFPLFADVGSGRFRISAGGQQLDVSSGHTVTSFGRGDSLFFSRIDDPESEVMIIVSFETPPLSLLRKGDGQALSWKVLDDRIEDEHARFRVDLTRLEQAKRGDEGDEGAPVSSIGHAYQVVFNGVALTTRQWVADQIRDLPYVRRVHYDQRVYATVEDGLRVVGADQVWVDHGVGGRGVVVGILDTGIDYMHPDLGGGIGPGYKVLGGYDFVNDDPDPMDDHSHGTHVAGIVAANGEIMGVAPEASLMAYKVLHAEGYGYESWIMAGIEQSVIDGVHILNASLGGPGAPDSPMSEAINNATVAGVLCVVAAGNSGSGYYTLDAPGNAREALTVGAIDNEGEIAWFSSRGPVKGTHAMKPEVVAPGVDIRSAVPGGGYERYSGTSMAAPIVAGAAALLLEKYPDMNTARIKSIFAQSAVDLGYDIWTQGHGRIDLPGAFTPPAFVVSPNMMGLGMVDLRQDYWLSTDTLTLTNMADEQQTISITTAKAFPDGVDMVFYPASISLQPGETQQLVVTITVNNRILPFAESYPSYYDASLMLQSAVYSLGVPLTFFKSPGLHLIFDEDPIWVTLFKHQLQFTTGFIEDQGSDIFIPLPLGTYDMIVSFTDQIEYLVFDHVVVEEITVMNLSRQDAKNRIEIISPGLNGEPLNLPHPSLDFDFPESGFWLSAGYTEPDGLFFINDFSGPNMQYYGSVTSDHGDHAYGIAFSLEECQSDVVLTYHPGDLVHFWAQFEEPADGITLAPATSIGKNHSWVTGLPQSPPLMNHPFIMNYSLTPDFLIEDPPFIMFTEIFEYHGFPFQPTQDDLVSRSPRKTVGSDGYPVFFSVDFYPQSIELKHVAGHSAHIDVTLGPPMFNGRVLSWSDDMIVFSNTDNLFLTQVMGYVPPKELGFTWLRDGEVHREGDFFETYPIRYHHYVWFEIDPGEHLLEINYEEFTVAGRQGRAMARLGFDPDSIDGIMPYLAAFNILFDEGYFTDCVGLDEPASVVFNLFGGGDGSTEAEVLLQLRGEEEADWQELELSRDGEWYTAAIPSVALPGYTDLRLQATDIQGNTFEYILEPAFLRMQAGLAEVVIHDHALDIFKGVAQLSAEVVSDGGSNVTEHGIVWGTMSHPTREEHGGIHSRGRGKGRFRAGVEELSPGNDYYARAFAVNRHGAAYSDPVFLGRVPLCQPPYGVSAADLTQTEATISWEHAGNAHTWDLVYSRHGFGKETEGTFHSNVSHPFTLDGLSHSTYYDVYVRAHCPEEESPWSEPLVFRTECGPMEVNFLSPAEGQVFEVTTAGHISFSMDLSVCDFSSFYVYIRNEYQHEVPVEVFYADHSQVMEGAFQLPATFAAGTYQFLVKYWFEGVQYSQASAPFMLTNSGRVVELYRPFEGEYWLMGYEHVISWNAVNVDKVNIQLSLDHGESWQEIGHDVPSSSDFYSIHGAFSFNWTVTGLPEGDYPQSMVRIVCADHPECQSQSGPFMISTQAPFSILSPGPESYVEAMGQADIVIESRVEANVSVAFIGPNGEFIYVGGFEIDPGINTLSCQTDQLIVGAAYYVQVDHLFINVSVYGGYIVHGEPFLVQKATPLVEWPVATPIVYGDRLTSIALVGGRAMVLETDVAGQFVVDIPDLVPVSGLHEIDALFIPDDEGTFNQVTGAITVTVEARALQLDGSFTVADKEYDGTVLAGILSSDLLLTGVLEGDDVFLDEVEVAFGQSLPGQEIPVRIIGVQLGGTDKQHYVVAMEAFPEAAASITGGNFNLYVAVVPEEAGHVSSSGNYLVGSSVTLSATANPGYQFSQWSGTWLPGPPQADDQQFTMPGHDVHLEAHFLLITHTTATGLAGIKLYPNPANSHVAIELPDGQQIAGIQVFDMTGRQLLQQAYDGVYHATVDVSSLRSGLYLIRIQSSAGVMQGRVQVLR